MEEGNKYHPPLVLLVLCVLSIRCKANSLKTQRFFAQFGELEETFKGPLNIRDILGE